MDDPKKADVRDKFLQNGGDPRWIDGNVGADDMANKGSALTAPPKILLIKEQLRLTTARTFQRMAVHMIAIARGYIAAESADGHEAEWEDTYLGFDETDDSNWEVGIEDALMDEVMFAGTCPTTSRRSSTTWKFATWMTPTTYGPVMCNQATHRKLRHHHTPCTATHQSRAQ
jgi:hypothetical protein